MRSLDDQSELTAREQDLADREVKVCAREEALIRREETLRGRIDVEDARLARERTLLPQLRDANEFLVLATLRADELAEKLAASLVIEAEGRRRAEALSEELQQKDEALRASESQFQTLANTIPMLAWYAAPDGDIAWFNQGWYDYTGTVFDELAGWKWESVHEPADLPRVLKGWRAALASGEPWEDVFRLRRADGEFRWFLARALPLRDPDGRIVRWFGTTVDINDQKRAEAAKDEFLAMLGHELRNPLAPILTVLEVMRLRAPTSFIEERALMERQVRHLVRLVDDLLDVSRIATGKIELRRERIEMADVVARAVEIVSPLLESKAHELILNVAPAGLVVEGDAIRLAQLVGNLLMNAAAYTPERGRIVVACERRGSLVALSVRDSGIGISAEMLPRVFDLFAQERQTTDRTVGGLGLGLAIARSVVTLHGGTVTARSEGLGRGSEFTIELPASNAEPGSAPTTGHDRDAVAFERKRVLVVDDNRDFTRALNHILTLLGHEVRTANDGPSALALAKQAIPEVVLLDIGLPGMDGYEVARRLHALVAPAALPIIAISGYGQDTDRQRSREAGFACHLVKPVDVEVLAESIREVTHQG